MSERVLVTGGAGFIGGHLVVELLHAGYEVRVLDNLTSQVHGGKPPFGNVSAGADVRIGDVLDVDAVADSLDGVTAVVHLAARVGVGQSMYHIAGYTASISLGTAVLLDAIATCPIRKLVVASSMSVYGEGLYRSPSDEIVTPAPRTRAQLERGDWEVRGPDGERLIAAPTAEMTPPAPQSVYGLAKHHEEQLCLLFGRTQGMPVVALRLFNVYGPGQAVSNPYTGVLVNFAARLLNRRRPLIYEDGLQQRDFVAVHDVVRACRAALECASADGLAINIGSGSPVSVLDAARAVALALGDDRKPTFVGMARVGDVRHCYADIGLARDVLAYRPRIGFHAGIAELAGWLTGMTAVDGVEAAARELIARGLAL